MAFHVQFTNGTLSKRIFFVSESSKTLKVQKKMLPREKKLSKIIKKFTGDIQNDKK